MANAEYMGGHPRMRKQMTGQIYIGKKGLRFKKGIFRKMFIPINAIKDMHALTEEQISKDVTLTRVLLLGIFALGAKKKTVTKSPYLTIDCTIDGGDTSIVFKDPAAHKHNAKYHAIQRKLAKGKN